MGQPAHLQWSAVGRVYKDYSRDLHSVVLIHRWSLYTGSQNRKYTPGDLYHVVFISRWSFIYRWSLSCLTIHVPEASTVTGSNTSSGRSHIIWSYMYLHLKFVQCAFSCVFSAQNTDNRTRYIIIGVCVGGVCLLIVLLAIGILLCKTKKDKTAGVLVRREVIFIALLCWYIV